jgi:mannose-6-phosphate isomerase
VGDAFIWLLSGASEVPAIVAAVTAGATAAPLEWPHQAGLASLYPGDPGIVGSLLLHHVVLARGEALYLPAGNIHAYLDGVGIELMNASDNVLRGGLTPKHVDVAELSRVVERAAGPVPLLAARVLADGVLEYRPDDPAAGFSLVGFGGSVGGTTGGPTAADGVVNAELAIDGPAIALCLDGAFDLVGAVGRARVERGQAVLVTPDERSLAVTGSGQLYVAR